MMKPNLIDFKLTISVGDTNVTKFVTASRGEPANRSNQTFIEAVSELETLLEPNTLLEDSPETEEKPVEAKVTKEKKTKNAKDNSKSYLRFDFRGGS